MNKSEWAKLTNWNPDGEQAEAEWETIHTVYQWHPAIPDQGGKAVLAGLFKVGGLGLLRDMEAGARAELAAEEDMRLAEQAVMSQADRVDEERKKLVDLKAELDRMRMARRVRHATYTDQGFAEQAPAPKRAA